MSEHNSSETVRATILVLDGEPIVAGLNRKDLPPRVKDNKFRIINDFKYYLKDGDVVNGKLINMLPHSKKDRRNYYFYIKENVDRKLQYDALVPIINEAVVEKLNNMVDLYGRPKEYIEVKNIMQKTRKPIFVLARNLGVYFLYKYLRHQMNDNDIANVYGLKRCTLLHSLSRLYNEQDPTINKVKDELNEELTKMINNISLTI